jgi:peptide/nickel transport system substrate-binding protein
MSKNKDRRITTDRSGDIARLSELYRTRSITRRDFNFALGALGLTAATAGGLVVSTRQAEAAPKRGGHLKVAAIQGGADLTLDPANFTQNTEYTHGYMLYSGLTRLDENLTPQPELAESFEPNADATEWVFKLRKGVEWHDGSPFTSADVVYSLNRHKNPEVGSNVSSFVEQVSDVVADDKHTARVKMAKPDADFAAVLGLFQMMITKEGVEDFRRAIGTGPFTMDEYEVGQTMLVERNPNYFRDDRPYLDSIEQFPISDPLARMNSLLSGDSHYAMAIEPQGIKQVSGTPGYVIHQSGGGRFNDFVMMTDRPPTDNNDLRLAIKFLQDRETVVNRILKGAGTIANDQPISPADPMYCDEIPQRPYDLDKAKFHLKKSGFTGTLTLHTGDVLAGMVDMGTLLQQSAQKIGLDIQIQTHPSDGYWTSTWMQFPFHNSAWNMRPTANSMLTLNHIGGAEWNESRFNHERFDKLLVESRGVTDLAKRKEMFCEMQWLIHNEGGVGIPAFTDLVDGAHESVKGIIKHPLENNCGAQYADLVWLDA